MLQRFTIAILALGIMSLPASTLAQTSSSTKDMLKPFADIKASIKLRADTAREKFKADREELRADRNEAMMEIKDDKNLSTSSRRELFTKEKANFLGQLDDLRSERLEAYADRIERRLAAAIERIENLIERLENRIDLLVTKNKEFDAETPRDMLGKARTSVGEAKVALADFQASMGELLATSTPKEAFGNVKTAASTVVEKIKSAHQNLVDAIKTIKASNEETTTSN